MPPWFSAAWAEHKNLLAASETLRLQQEHKSSGGGGSASPAPTWSDSPPASPPKPAPLFFFSLRYWVGDFSVAEARTLCVELYCGTPRTALFAAAAMFCGCVCAIYKASARGKCLDAMASLALQAHAHKTRDLWGWREGWDGLYTLALWTFLEWVCAVLKDVLIGLARAQRLGQSRALYFASLLRQDMAFHAKHPSGELAARLATDSECLDGLCIHGPERFLQGCVSLGTLGWFLWADPLLLLLALVLRLPQLLQITEMSVRLAAAYERLADHKAQVAQARAADSLGSVRVVQAHGAERQEVEGYCAAIGEHLRVVRASATVKSLLKHSEGLVLLVTEVGLLAFGGWRIMAGAQTLGSFTARREYSNSLVENFHGLEHCYEMVRRCQLLLGRYLSLRNRRPEVYMPLPLPHPLPEALSETSLPASLLAEHQRDEKEEEAFLALLQQPQQQPRRRRPEPHQPRPAVAPPQR